MVPLLKKKGNIENSKVDSFVLLPISVSNAWRLNLWRVGALFNITGCSLITSSKASHTTGASCSTKFLAIFMVDACTILMASYAEFL